MGQARVVIRMSSRSLNLVILTLNSKGHSSWESTGSKWKTNWKRKKDDLKWSTCMKKTHSKTCIRPHLSSLLRSLSTWHSVWLKNHPLAWSLTMNGASDLSLRWTSSRPRPPLTRAKRTLRTSLATSIPTHSPIPTTHIKLSTSDSNTHPKILAHFTQPMPIYPLYSMCNWVSIKICRDNTSGISLRWWTTTRAEKTGSSSTSGSKTMWWECTLHLSNGTRLPTRSKVSSLWTSPPPSNHT